MYKKAIAVVLLLFVFCLGYMLALNMQRVSTPGVIRIDLIRLDDGQVGYQIDGIQAPREDMSTVLWERIEVKRRFAKGTRRWSLVQAIIHADPDMTFKDVDEAVSVCRGCGLAQAYIQTDDLMMPVQKSIYRFGNLSHKVVPQVLFLTLQLVNPESNRLTRSPDGKLYFILQDLAAYTGKGTRWFRPIHTENWEEVLNSLQDTVGITGWAGSSISNPNKYSLVCVIVDYQVHIKDVARVLAACLRMGTGYDVKCSPPY